MHACHSVNRQPSSVLLQQRGSCFTVDAENLKEVVKHVCTQYRLSFITSICKHCSQKESYILKNITLIYWGILYILTMGGLNNVLSDIKSVYSRVDMILFKYGESVYFSQSLLTDILGVTLSCWQYANICVLSYRLISPQLVNYGMKWI